MYVLKRIQCLFMALIFISGGSAFAQKSPPEVLTFKSDEMGLSIKHSSNWSIAPSFYSNQIKLVDVPGHAKATAPVTSSVKVFVEERLDHDDAVQRLQTIASGMNAPESAFMEIGGWPAVQHGRIVDRPKPSKATGVEDKKMFLITTVIAAGNEVIRMQGILPSAANESIKNEARFIGRGMGFKAVGVADKTRMELEKLRASTAASKESKNNVEAVDGAANLSAVLESYTTHAESAEGFNQRVLMTGFGEVEIAVSPDGQNIVIGRQGDWVASNDGGQTFSAPQTVGAFDGGDPSVAYAQSGAFYYAGIDRNCAAGFDCTGMAQSLDNGATFPLVTPAVVCPTRPQPDNSGCFPDQEHIAADAFNAGTGGGDQVYSVWRNFDDNGDQDPAIVCSQDSGQNWTAPAVVDNPSGSSFPRVGVGSDGSVYVAYYDGGNFELRKYSSCANGLVPQPIVTVAARTAVECPFPGHDRCDQNPTSQMVAVDDTNPNHVYYAYGQGGGAGNDNIFVRDSLDAGATWPAGRAVRVNAAVPGKRIMPWVCASEGQAYVTWYDRRAAPANQNDLTDFYGGRVGLNGAGDLTVEEEFRISEVGDPWCASGWPCGTRGAPGASENCSVQPQLAGWCGNAAPYTNTRCDFSDCGGVGNNGGGACQCPGGTVCQAGSRQGNAGGCPKYGDYNGNACMAGRLYAAWASATSPVGVPLPNAGRIGLLFDFFLLGDVSQIQVPGPLDFGDVCESSGTVTETLEICNTGNSNLEVNSISSDNPQFSVTDPSAGYPVIISPDFCFPFQAQYSPDTSGNASATLTIASNDPATPEVLVALDASVGEAAINTFIVDSGNFGEICSGDLHDLNLTIQSNGSCPLEIDSVSLSGADAADFELPAGSFAGTIIEPGNSLLVPVRFAPDNFTDPNPRTASVDVASSTQGGDALALDHTPIQGTVPPPDINLAIANEGDFGNVCKGDFADLDLTLFNQGKCDLEISNIELVPSDGSFELPANMVLPLTLSPDADFTYPVRYAPEECNDTPETADIAVTSDDPDTPVWSVGISGTSPCPNLVIDPVALSGLYAFPATVVDTGATLGCYSERDVTLRNTGLCPLSIDNISAAGLDYTVMAPTLFPIILPTGEETLDVTVRFTPQDDLDPQVPSEVTGLLTIISDDPDFPHSADLCGESALQSGVRILVTDVSSGIPIAVDEVDSMSIQSKGKNRPGPINLQFTDQPLSSEDVCGNTIAYHVNQETLPSTYTTGVDPKSSYSAKAMEGNLQASESFPLGQCEFRDFQLELQDSDAPDCVLLPKGASCTTAGDCCSGKCKGPTGGKTCK